MHFRKSYDFNPVQTNDTTAILCEPLTSGSARRTESRHAGVHTCTSHDHEACIVGSLVIQLGADDDGLTNVFIAYHFEIFPM
jgi:hypothetical protein